MGFEAAGFEVALAIDTWSDAIKTYNHNHSSPVGKVMDIKELDDEQIDSIISEGPITGVIGGPPCQGFSTVGTRDVEDDRSHLYMEYYRVVKKIKPKFFVIENVQGMLTLAKGAFKEDVVSRFSALGYNVTYSLLNAKDFGIPQHRKRVFFVGLMEGEFIFPDISNTLEVTTREALSDLTPLDVEHKEVGTFDYPSPPKSDYQKYIRGESKQITNHLITMHTEQTKHIIGMIPDGGRITDLPREYWEVRKFNKAFQRMPVWCFSNSRHRSQELFPLRTESYTYCKRKRSFTAQDDWEPLGSKTSQYKQIGNAVPPLSETLAKVLKRNLRLN